MQSRIRKKISSRGHSRAGINSFTSISRKVITPLLLVGLVSSCAHLKKTPKNEKAVLKEFSDGLNSTCLSGSGKGRIKFLGSKYVFSYESLNKPVQNKWLLGLQIPVHGEEILTLDWSRADEKKARFLGSFAKRLNRAAANQDKKLVKQMSSYLIYLATFIKSYEFNKTNNVESWCKATDVTSFSKKGSCVLGSVKFTWEMKNNHLYVKFPIRGNHMVVDLFDKDEHYRRISLSVMNSDGVKLDTSSFEMDLFVRECAAK